MTDRYAVIGNPIAHSRSPEIHAAFARATGEDLEYGRLLAPLDGFAASVAAFRAAGGRGLNVTLPFKGEACRLATERSARAAAVEAVNTLRFEGTRILGDTTDGVGLVRDLDANLGVALGGRRVLLVGAGGASRSVIPALLDARPAAIVVVNRTAERAAALERQFGARVQATGFATLPRRPFDVVINATSAGHAGELPPLERTLFAADALAYDMTYGKGAEPFLALARAAGAARVADGLGMLVEQAAESFFLWRGVRPDTAPVLAMLRAAA
jgi:shikimate dehydrogenase